MRADYLAGGRAAGPEIDGGEHLAHLLQWKRTIPEVEIVP